MEWVIAGGIMVAIYLVLRWHGIKYAKGAAEELERLQSGENYYRLCRVVDDRGRELRCRVREWEVRPGLSELWCIDPISHPNGWTESFIWPSDGIEFLEK